MTDDGIQHIPVAVLQDFCVQIFQACGVAEDDARLGAEVLIAADLRGVASHGVAHLRRNGRSQQISRWAGRA